MNVSRGAFQRHSDIPLNDVGQAQVRDAALALEGRTIELIITSSLIGALKTATVVAERIGKPILVDSELRARHVGALLIASRAVRAAKPVEMAEHDASNRG